MRLLSAFLGGLLLGAGLLLSGMSDPMKVLAFLDLAGRWDPSLALVMAGAIGIAIGPFQWAVRRQARKHEAGEHFPSSGIDADLLLGAGMFGIGWGLSGFCPGPGIVSLGAAYWPGCVFFVAMVLGMLLHARHRRGHARTS